MVQVINAGVVSLEKAPKNDADPTGVAGLRAMADALDKVAADAGGVQLTLPELKKMRDEYQRIAKDIAKAERELAAAAQDRDAIATDGGGGHARRGREAGRSARGSDQQVLPGAVASGGRGTAERRRGHGAGRPLTGRRARNMYPSGGERALRSPGWAIREPRPFHEPLRSVRKDRSLREAALRRSPGRPGRSRRWTTSPERSPRRPTPSPARTARGTSRSSSGRSRRSSPGTTTTSPPTSLRR